MTQHEFEERIHKEINDSDYEIIETVYAFHPSISETNGKEEVATLFNMFGMRVFRDMLPTAQRAKSLESEIRITKSYLADLENRYEELKK